MKLKVCHIVSALNVGGITSVVINICNSLVDYSDITIGVYTNQPVQRPSNLDRSVNIVQFSSFRDYRVLLQQQFDIIHLHLMLKSGVFALLTRLMSKSKVIVHSHTSKDYRFSFIYKFGYKPISKFLINHFSSLCIACSEVAGDYLFNHHPYVVLENAISASLFSFNNLKRNEIRGQYNIHESTFVIGFVGHIHEVKNLIFLKNVVEQLSQNLNVKLMIVGSATEDPELENKLKLSSTTIVTGFVNNTYDYYNAFDLFALPSLFEGMPMVAIEAQASGLTCLLSNTITKLVNIDNHCIYIDNKSVESWVNIIANYKDKKLSRNNVVENSSFDINVMSQHLLGFYINLCK